MLPSREQFKDFIAGKSKEELADFILKKYDYVDPNQAFVLFEELILQYHLEYLTYEHLDCNVKEFDHESRKGLYFEDFDFNKLGVDHIPDKTREWFSRIGVLLDLVCLLAAKNQSLAVKSLFDRLFDLVEYMVDSSAVVFAHEYGESDIYCVHYYRSVYENLVLSLSQEG